MRTRRSKTDSAAGFTLVELLVILVVIGMVAAWGYPSMLGILAKIKLTNTAREATVFMQLARINAAKRSVPTQVIYMNKTDSLTGHPCLLAFADMDGNGSFDNGTDEILAGPYDLPPGVELWGPTDPKKEMTHSIDVWDDGANPNKGPIFASDGSAQSEGAFRFRDRNGNFLEARVEFAGTGKTIIQKWFGGADNQSRWFQNGEKDHPWTW
jgi:prepilin-type N-terminal cleavage/methylation domain-containing protein